MRLINLASTLWVIAVAFGGALGPRELFRALPTWLSQPPRP